MSELTHQEALRALDAVAALHASDGARWPMCVECAHRWPCATVEALDPATEQTDRPDRRVSDIDGNLSPTY